MPFGKKIIGTNTGVLIWDLKNLDKTKRKRKAI